MCLAVEVVTANSLKYGTPPAQPMALSTIYSRWKRQQVLNSRKLKEYGKTLRGDSTWLVTR